MKKLFIILALLICVYPCVVTPQSSEKVSDKDSRDRAKKERKEFEQAQKDRWKFFSVTSEPPGAKVEINGEVLGETPMKNPVKVKFFYNGPTFAFSSYLAAPLTMTVSKEGYVSKTIEITKGPYLWVSLNGVNRLVYYVVASPEYNIKLERVGEFLGTNPFAKLVDLPKSSGLTESVETTEQVIQRVLPAIVTVKTPSGGGSGFFILGSGIVVTNKHVVKSFESVSVVTSKGESIQSKSIYVHPTRDIALIKLEGNDYPALEIADPATVNVGAEVLAVGSPGLGSVSLQNTVTKGIISSFRSSESNGLLIQTDAALNHGNSGGPLLNRTGQVIGVNTLGFADFNKEGLNFAVFCSEILQVLKDQFNFIPERKQSSPVTSGSTATPTKIPTRITSEPSGAEIYVDGKFVGSAPSEITLAPGDHEIKVTRTGYNEWIRTVTIEVGNSLSVNAVLMPIRPN